MSKNLLFICAFTLILSACGGPNNKEAAACFNSDLYEAGNQQISAMLSEDNGVNRVDITQSKGVDENNVAELEVKSYRLKNNKIPEIPNSVQAITTQIDKTNKQFIRLRVHEVDKDGNQTEVILTPHYANSFNFEEGDDSQFSVTKQVIRHDGKEGETGSEYRTKRNYLGTTEITTPLGTFETCHMRETIELINTDDNKFQYTQISDAYVSKNTGLLVKNERTSHLEGNLTEKFSAVTFLLKANLADKHYIASSAWLKAHNLQEMITAD